MESKSSVLASDSAPWAGISWPFQRKVTPAALPMRAMISREAWMEVWAGAMRVSSVTGSPSAVMEIQEFSVARMTSVSEAPGFAAGAVVNFAAGGVVPLLPAGLLGGVADGCVGGEAGVAEAEAFGG